MREALARIAFQRLLPQESGQFMHQKHRANAKRAQARRQRRGGAGVDDRAREAVANEARERGLRIRQSLEHCHRPDSAIGVFESAAVAQDKVNVEPHGALQGLPDVEQEMLRPARERVVTYQQQPERPGDRAGRGATGGIEIGRPVVHVGLQIGASHHSFQALTQTKGSPKNG